MTVVIDPVWGISTFDTWTTELLSSPEIQRLKHVRLLNSAPETLASLGDVRRYTHTLGVVSLAIRICSSDSFVGSKSDARTLIAAAALHDVCTPPFGHTLEYLFNRLSGWHHEEFVLSVLNGTYRPEGKYAQVFHGHRLSLKELLRKGGVSEIAVAETIGGGGRFGSLIAGGLDLDNIDNIFRMAHHLALSKDVRAAYELVDCIDLTTNPISWTNTVLETVDVWTSLRKRVYEVLAFDVANLTYQAMLTDVLEIAIREEILGIEHWSWTDEMLLSRLEKYPPTADLTQRLLSGPPYQPIFIGWYQSAGDTGRYMTDEFRVTLANRLEKELSVAVTPFFFYDRGMFEKQLTLKVSESMGSNDTKIKILGKASSSIIACVFAQKPSYKLTSADVVCVREVLNEIGLDRKLLIDKPTKASIYGLPGQAKLFN